jgi:hypothetical protein
LGHEKIMRLFFDSNWVRRNVALNGNYSLWWVLKKSFFSLTTYYSHK